MDDAAGSDRRRPGHERRRVHNGRIAFVRATSRLRRRRRRPGSFGEATQASSSASGWSATKSVGPSTVLSCSRHPCTAGSSSSTPITSQIGDTSLAALISSSVSREARPLPAPAAGEASPRAPGQRVLGGRPPSAPRAEPARMLRRRLRMPFLGRVVAADDHGRQAREVQEDVRGVRERSTS